jgi:hypothetical protein
MGEKLSHSRKGRTRIEGVRRIFEPKRDEVIKDGRNVHSEELHNVYSSLNIMR